MNDLQRKEFILKSRKIGSLIIAIPDSSRSFDVEVKYIKDTIESFKDRYGSVCECSLKSLSANSNLLNIKTTIIIDFKLSQNQI